MKQRVRVVVWASLGLAAAVVLVWWWQRPASLATQAGAPAAQRAADAIVPGGSPGVGVWLSAAPESPTRVAGARAGGPVGGGPVAVEVQSVQLGPRAEEVQAVGTPRARQSVVLRPKVAGWVVAVGFVDGATVRRGQLLFSLDDALPRAELAQAVAQLAVHQANLRRTEELVAQGFVAQCTLDESRAAVAVAQAQVELARTRWQRTRLLAPFDA